MTRRILLSALLGTALVFGAGVSCLSPTLPLPPPEEPSHVERSSTEGVWDIRGDCTAGAIVLLKNERTGALVGFDDDRHTGRYRVELPAEECDPAMVYEIVDGELTQGQSFVVQEVLGGLPTSDVCEP